MNTRRHTLRSRLASWLMLAFGGLFAANAALAVFRGFSNAIDASFAVLVFVTAAWTAAGLWEDARWARRVAPLLAATGLFFVLPVAGTIALGGALEPVGTGWDVVYFPLTAIVLIALLAVLWGSRAAVSIRDGSTLGES